MMSKTWSTRTAGGLIIVLIAAAMRFAAILHWGAGYDVTTTIDDYEYTVLAKNLRFNGIFGYSIPVPPWGVLPSLEADGPYAPVATRAPLLSFLIAALWWQPPPPVLAVQVTQAILGVLTTFFVYLFSLRVFGVGAALVSGLMVALGPATIYYTTFLLTETLFTFLLTSFALCLSTRRGVVAGLCLGAAILTRAVALPLAGILLLAGAAMRFNRSLHLKVAVIALAVVAPWTIRNAITQHALIPVASVGWGTNLFMGTIDVPYGSGHTWWTFEKDTEFSDIKQASTDVRDAERRMASAALERIRQDPLQWLWLRIKQYPRFWSSSGGYLSTAPIFKYSYVTLSACFWLLAVVGMVLARRRWRQLYVVALVPIAFAGLHFVGSADERYSLPLVPMAAIFGGYAISVFLARVGCLQHDHKLDS